MAANQHRVQRERVDEFYDVEFMVREPIPGVWHGRASLVRLDTQERVANGVAIRGTDRNVVTVELQQRIQAVVAEAERPPVEWQQIDVRTLVRDYIAYREECVRVVMNSRSHAAATEGADVALREGLHQVRELAERTSVQFVQRLQAMTDHQRSAVVKSPDSVMQDPQNVSHLDDIRARCELFEFIVNPSPAVMSAHEAHLRQLNSGNVREVSR